MVEKTWFFVKNHHPIKPQCPAEMVGTKKKEKEITYTFRILMEGFFFSMMQTEAEQEISLDGGNFRKFFVMSELSQPALSDAC